MTRDDDIIDRLDALLALLERIADAVAPTPEQRALRAEAEEFEVSRQRLQAWQRYFPPVHTNAIAGPQTGRGVK